MSFASNYIYYFILLASFMRRQSYDSLSARPEGYWQLVAGLPKWQCGKKPHGMVNGSASANVVRYRRHDDSLMKNMVLSFIAMRLWSGCSTGGSSCRRSWARAFVMAEMLPCRIGLLPIGSHRGAWVYFGVYLISICRRRKELKKVKGHRFAQNRTSIHRLQLLLPWRTDLHDVQQFSWPSAVYALDS
jgi:hypothetical protein